MQTVETLAEDVGVRDACTALAVPRSSYYRARRGPVPRKPRPRPPLALSAEQRQEVLDHMRSERFVDMAPASIHATLLDEGVYLCSVRTMYRILEAEDEVRERRNQLRRPSYTKPELLATGPNQVWSWDITKLRGPRTWSYFHLYVVLDIYSRCVVGWMVAERESQTLAKRLLEETVEKQDIKPGELTIHADRGPSMTSKPVAQLYAELGVTKTHSRPYTSNDNPYSEAHFKTLKYRPDFPDRFGSIEDAKGFCRRFFTWYNVEHRHSGLAYVTPEDAHYGRTEEIFARRDETRRAAFEAHPNRFKGRVPRSDKLPGKVWINPPPPTEEKAH
jgi:putative transposase